jgi:hypothetical protein
LRWIVIVVIGLASSVARAETPEELQAHGEELAKQGRYSDAIDAFKSAERLAPHAKNACLISLAYSRRELWPQAELFLQQCHARASASDPLPDWVAAEDAQIAERLAAANIALIHFTIAPDVAVKITISSFALDEELAQHWVHLPFGHHVITATAPGYETAHVDVEVSSRTDKRIVITMHPIAAHYVTKRGGPVPWYVVGGGAAIALGGVATDVLWAQPLRTKLQNATTGAIYDQSSKRYDHAVDATWALYGVGAAAMITGVVLRYTVFRDREEVVSATPIAGGAMINVGWSR